MAISGIGAASAAYSTAAARTASASADKPADTAAPAAAQDSPSSIVTLGNGQTSSVTPYAGTLQATPLAVAWAPQTLVAGDKNQDQQLSENEFADQLKRIGVSADDAKKLFDSFDTSQDGSVSVDEFVKGVTKDIAGGSTTFTQLIDSYTQDASGQTDGQAMDDFLAKGAALARQYAQMSGQGR